MIPSGSSIGADLTIESDFSSETSRTYKLNPETGIIVGMTDGLDAIKQAVHKIMRTERFQYLIYSADYGSELLSLIGQDRHLYKSELNRRIEEALLQDDRVNAVENLRIEFMEDSTLVWFTVVTPYGNFQANQEVK